MSAITQGELVVYLLILSAQNLLTSAAASNNETAKALVSDRVLNLTLWTIEALEIEKANVDILKFRFTLFIDNKKARKIKCYCCLL